ncbi:hypothetical protein [Streptomyces sp. NPDC059802]|uniref:hypothetical protein n=1 Tax=Streptomyces sp. NPDC059802 TaxID=3346952 RepID=UPI0036539758
MGVRRHHPAEHQRYDAATVVALQPSALPPFTAAKMIHSLATLYQWRIGINLATGYPKLRQRQRLTEVLDLHLLGWRDGRTGIAFESGR